jgi:hypothetical protein
MAHCSEVETSFSSPPGRYTSGWHAGESRARKKRGRFAGPRKSDAVAATTRDSTVPSRWGAPLGGQRDAEAVPAVLGRVGNDCVTGGDGAPPGRGQGHGASRLNILSVAPPR